MKASLPAALVAAIVSLPSLASAQDFVRTTTCNVAGAINACEPGETPKPIEWPRTCISYYINERGTLDIEGDDPNVIAPGLIDATRAGFAAWNEPDGSSFEYVYGGLTNEDRAEWVPERGRDKNANIVVWREQWPEDFSRTAYAITSVSFNPETAEILDADIELNSEFHEFTIDEENAIVDVQNTIAHESGHFLGLDHSPDRLATMYGSAPLGQTIKRTLEEGDIEGVSTIYPAAMGNDTCEEPGGFFQKPADPDDGCCSTVDAGTESSTPIWLVVAFLLGFTVRRRSLRD